MVEHWFYHLQHSPLETILCDILEKVSANGWTCCVCMGPYRGEAKAELARLDAYLWTYKQNSFLAHGRDDEPSADEQPILLTADALPERPFDVVVFVGGAKCDDIRFGKTPPKRCITILDGNNEDDKAVARARWKQAQAADLKTCYWKQNDRGKWVQPDI